MKAYICDRCSKVLRDRNEVEAIANEIAIWIYNGSQRLDLCRNCIEELKKWIEEVRKSKEKDDAG
jgi:hypothetical protein